MSNQLTQMTTEKVVFVRAGEDLIASGRQLIRIGRELMQASAPIDNFRAPEPKESRN